MIYVIVIAALLAPLDAPIASTNRQLADYKMYVGKYVELLLRMTGKGIVLIFLGTTLFTSVWANTTSLAVHIFAVMLFLVIFLAGVAAIIVGGMTTRKLNETRRKL